MSIQGFRPFADAAPLYGELGLIPVPLRTDKRPAVRNWQKFRPDTWESLVEKFPDHNIGAINGRAPLPLTVIDIDDPADRDWCRERFGDTPVKVRTPSGGEHWYFRGNGEGRRTRFEGRKVDVLGHGGYGVLPPSRTPNGRYEFLTGDAWAFADLPSLHGLEQSVAAKEKDGRNNWLFDRLRQLAVAIESYEVLLQQGLLHNELFDTPLDEQEVVWIVKSVWKYKLAGRLMVAGCEAHIINTASTLDACEGNTDALFLLSRLKQYHGSKHGEPFVLANATARSLGWAAKRFRKARDHLIAVGELELVQKGERGRKHATVVRLPRKWVNSTNNVTPQSPSRAGRGAR